MLAISNEANTAGSSSKGIRKGRNCTGNRELTPMLFDRSSAVSVTGAFCARFWRGFLALGAGDSLLSFSYCSKSFDKRYVSFCFLARSEKRFEQRIRIGVRVRLGSLAERLSYLRGYQFFEVGLRWRWRQNLGASERTRLGHCLSPRYWGLVLRVARAESNARKFLQACQHSAWRIYRSY